MLIARIFSFSHNVSYSINHKFHYLSYVNFFLLSTNPSKHSEKRRKTWCPALSPFPTMFSTLSKTNFIIWVTVVVYKSFKALRQKKKLLVSSIFYFSHNVSYSIKHNFHSLSHICCLQILQSIVRKVENAGAQHFLLFPQCFLLYQTQILLFEQHLFSSNPLNIERSIFLLCAKRSTSFSTYINLAAQKLACSSFR